MHTHTHVIHVHVARALLIFCDNNLISSDLCLTFDMIRTCIPYHTVTAYIYTWNPNNNITFLLSAVGRFRMLCRFTVMI